MKYKCIVFDCDGTLLDTIKDLTNAVNYALRKLGCQNQTDEMTLFMVGNGIKKLIERALPENMLDKFDDALNYFKEYYNEHFADNTAPYPGIIELLRVLKQKGYKLALVSNKNNKYLSLLFDKFFVDYLDICLGEMDGLMPKPYPDMVNYVLKKLNISSSDAVYVGDSDVDIMTAKNSGLDGIFVSWGFKHKDFLKNNGASIIIDTPNELVGLV